MNALVIPLDGWAAGERNFRSHAGLEFFQTFDNTEILDASVDVEVKVVKTGAQKVTADLQLRGTVTVPCDRCLEPLTLPVEASQRFSVRFDATEEDLSEDGREILQVGVADKELDLRQAVYDYVCLSLPIQRVHPEGGCNPDTVRFLSREHGDEEAASSSPFAALKGLFEANNN
ncbi:MAG: DUF177 domain-containing protein [Bacteroidales bacterium]|nr:DUF177 domain-containing protein [Bacteroidales bacterium]